MKRILLLLILVLSQAAAAAITELASIRDLKVSEIDQNTLVVFDIDNTLLRQNSMIGTHQWGDYMAERAKRRGLDEAAAKAVQHAAFAEIQPVVEVIPVENEVLQVLEQLQKKNIPHFALTARPANIKELTLTQLQVLHHDFESNFPQQNDKSLLDGFLRQGVIFSGSTPKGELLQTIIQNSKQKPLRIIFVDDKRYNLESVEKSFAGSNIILQSLRYGAADGVVSRFDSKIADVEYSVFKDSRELISDEEAVEVAGDPERIAQAAFDIFVRRQGPSVEPMGTCQKVNGPMPADFTLVRCKYMFDKEWPADQEYRIIKDDFSGGLFFGNW